MSTQGKDDRAVVILDIEGKVNEFDTIIENGDHAGPIRASHITWSYSGPTMLWSKEELSQLRPYLNTNGYPASLKLNTP